MYMNITNHYNNITSNKLFFSGLAITGILLSHLIGVDENNLAWCIFYPGFVGVDIFLFYSGYGLCRSFERNTLREFYARRLKRIYPMLCIFTIATYAILHFLQHNDFTFFDVICNLTALNFWSIGGIKAEWYLCFIVYMYLLFPVLYLFIRKGNIWTIFIAFICLFTFLIIHQDGWFYQCAFSRVPIFMLGILCYQQNDAHTYTKGMLIFLVAFIIMTILFIGGIVQKFELVYMAAPYILFILAWGCKSIIKKQARTFHIINFVGKYSLEIYVANMLILQIIPYLNFQIPIALTYMGLHVLLVPVIVFINLFIQKKI